MKPATVHVQLKSENMEVSVHLITDEVSVAFESGYYPLDAVVSQLEEMARALTELGCGTIPMGSGES